METAATSRKRKSPPLGKRTWTPEDENYLAEKWGYASVPAIAKKLNRTENAVVVRAQRLGLGAVLMAGGYVTLNQLLATVTGRERGAACSRSGGAGLDLLLRPERHHRQLLSQLRQQKARAEVRRGQLEVHLRRHCQRKVLPRMRQSQTGACRGGLDLLLRRGEQG